MTIFAHKFTTQPNTTNPLVMKLLLILLQFTIMTYNVENLFDTRHDTLKNDQEFCLGGSKNWSNALLSRKIHNLMRVIVAQDDLPAIVSLCEVENDSILIRMTSGRYSRLNYGFIHYESNDARGIDVALLYRRDLLKPDTSFLFAPKNINRQMLYARFSTRQGLKIHAIQAHLPSRRGGAIQTEHLRISATSAIRHLTDSILSANPNAAIIIMGDMNDNPTDNSIQQLLNNTKLVNLCARLYNEGKGTYYHQNEWSMLDQIIVSTSLLDGSLSIRLSPQVLIFNPVWLQDDKGAPRRTYRGNYYNGGISDHFPLICK